MRIAGDRITNDLYAAQEDVGVWRIPQHGKPGSCWRRFASSASRLFTTSRPRSASRPDPSARTRGSTSVRTPKG